MTEASVSAGLAACEAGRWSEARAAFEAALTVADDPGTRFHLASVLWWQGENQAGVREAARAYALFRAVRDVRGAVLCAVWLSLIYHGDFANHAAANGWTSRAETLLHDRQPGALHGWVRLTRAELTDDLRAAEALTTESLQLARSAEDPDLELSALAQLGRIRIARGQISGFAMIDEAMAAALAGEHTSFDTVVNTSCDMLTACELADDLVRAEQWCRVIDDFVQRFGCPYLYAECRVMYGSVLTACGRWGEAEEQLTAGIRATRGVSPCLHARASTRLAALRVKQGRLTEAEQLLRTVDPEVEPRTETLVCHAALHLARDDAATASRILHECRYKASGHIAHRATALAMLVEASLTRGARAAAARAAAELTAIAAASDSPQFDALAAGARGRLAAATGDTAAAMTDLRAALAAWTRLHQPFEAARTRAVLGTVLADAGDPGAADCLRWALKDLADLGARLDVGRVARTLRSVDVVARTGRVGGRVRPDGVSEREEQVLRLVAAGLSNPEIATRLCVSRKTVAHHVSHILTKLGLRNRAQIAAYAAAHLVDPPLPGRPE